MSDAAVPPNVRIVLVVPGASVPLGDIKNSEGFSKPIESLATLRGIARPVRLRVRPAASLLDTLNPRSNIFGPGVEGHMRRGFLRPSGCCSGCHWRCHGDKFDQQEEVRVIASASTNDRTELTGWCLFTYPIRQARPPSTRLSRGLSASRHHTRSNFADHYVLVCYMHGCHYARYDCC